jgi:hypothetical protein
MASELFKRIRRRLDFSLFYCGRYMIVWKMSRMAKNNLATEAALKLTSTAKTKKCPKKKTPYKRSLKQ